MTTATMTSRLSLADLLELTKPRITTLNLIATAAGFGLARNGASFSTFVATLVGTSTPPERSSSVGVPGPDAAGSPPRSENQATPPAASVASARMRMAFGPAPVVVSAMTCLRDWGPNDSSPAGPAPLWEPGTARSR